MYILNFAFRYQQKIGSYDKQKWEKSLEEEIKIIENAFPLRNTKLKNDLIDVDLVRGSTFQKQKPKQTILQVLYLSCLRYFLLPLFSKWWIKETSPRFFLVLLLLYFLQMVNWAIYSLHVRRSSDSDKEKNINPEDETLLELELCELLIPMGLSLLLCFTHSHIVATSVFPLHTSSSNKGRRPYYKNREKLRKKKKNSRQRPSSSRDDNLKGYDSDDEQSVVMNSKGKKSIEEENELNTSHESDTTPLLLRRRNVNWNLNDIINSCSSSKNNRRSECDLERNPLLSPRSTEDDGFESFKEKDESNSDTETLKNSERNTPVKMNREKLKHSSDSEGDVDSPNACSSNQFETTDGEYMIGVTSNSESDQCEDDEYHNSYNSDDDDNNVPTKILNSNDSSERVSVTVWTKHEAKKAEMNVLEISSAIINRVDSIPETFDYLYIGMVFAVLLSLTPVYCRLCDVKDANSTNIIFDLPKVVIEETFTITSFIHVAFGQNFWLRALLIISTFQRLVLAFFFFFLLAVAERTFKQRQVIVFISLFLNCWCNYLFF